VFGNNKSLILHYKTNYMKKIYLLFCGMLLGAGLHAQTVPGGDMETWRSTTSGSISAVSIQAPWAWYCPDSLIIADGQTYGIILGYSPSDFHRQLFQESTVKHGGSYSAKLITVADSALGVFPGLLSNAQAHVSVSISGSIGAPTYTGGTPVTERITTVSAWVEYLPGIDSGTSTHGIDTGMLTVEAMAPIHGFDSVVAVGTVQIIPVDTFMQVTATLVYTDTVDNIDTIRILFASGGGGRTRALDSSILYVDDVTMAGVPFPSHAGVNNIATAGNVKVYPNPATQTLYIDGTSSSQTCTIYSVNGQRVISKTFAGHDAIDISALSGGIYFYTISDAYGNVSQRGKVCVAP
jgi:Secretion system C-terminal sorting domain